MSDNTQISLETDGDIVATDDIGGIKYQRMKIVLGADGVNDGDVSSANPMPVSGVFYPAIQPVSGTVAVNVGLTDDELRNTPIEVSSSLSGASTNGTVTLTNANTAYAIPATGIAANHTLMIYNGSDTDIFIGFATLTSGGILLPSGGVLTCDLGANQVIYGYCASAGKIVNYSTKKVA